MPIRVRAKGVSGGWEAAVDLPDGATVATLKDEVGKSKGRVCSKIVCAGSVLDDDSAAVSSVPALASGESFVVCIFTKKVYGAAAAPAAAAPAAAAPAAAAPAAAAPAPASGAPAAASAGGAPPAPPAPAPAAHAPPPAPAPAGDAAAIAQLTAMGFTAEQASFGLGATGGDVAMAVGLLSGGDGSAGPGDMGGMGGLGLVALGADAPGLMFAAAGDADADDDEDDEGEDLTGGMSLAHLVADPRFQAIRDRVRSDPSTLPAVMAEIGASDPALLDLIREHQEEFLALLMTDDLDGMMDAMGGLDDGSEGSVASEDGDYEGGGGFVVDPDGAVAGGALPALTPADNEAIARLEGMGFGHDAVVTAFLACDKNEMLAANMLMDS